MLSPSFECVSANAQPTERANSTYIQPQPTAAVSEYVVGGFQPNTVREYEVSEYAVGQAGNSTNNDNTRTATTAVTGSTTAVRTTTAVAVATQVPSANRPSTRFVLVSFSLMFSKIRKNYVRKNCPQVHFFLFSNATTSSSTSHHHRSTPHPQASAERSTLVMEPPPEILILRCYSMERHPKLSRSAIRDAVYGGKVRNFEFRKFSTKFRNF